MGSAQMKQLFKISKIIFYFAGDGFMFKGLYMWNGKTQFRVIPLNEFKNWTGKYDDED